ATMASCGSVPTNRRCPMSRRSDGHHSRTPRGTWDSPCARHDVRRKTTRNAGLVSFLPKGPRRASRGVFMSGLDRFVSLCDSVFAESLAGPGFTGTSERSEAGYYSGLGIGTSLFLPTDGTPHCGIHLGEGSDDWPETDWNKIALWQLRESTDRGADAPRR